MKKNVCRKALLASLAAASLFFGSLPVLAEQTPTPEEGEPAQAADTILTNQTEGWPQGPVITSTAAVVLEPTTGTVLYSKNADQPLFPSSSVKIMTALVALENSSLDDQVTMTATGVSGVTDGGVSISAQIDEVFTMEQCLYAVMLASANDISLQIAEHVGGSVENFVALMNQKAQEFGCTNTVFTNPTGLPDENQHTTAHDLALIMENAMKSSTFRTIAGSQSYTIPATNLSGGARALTNTFTMMNPQSDAYYEGCLGGKEGFTYASGSVLTCMTNRNGVDLVCAVMNGAADQTDDEAITILDYAYNNFQMLDLGTDDFNILSGGKVYVPAGTTADQLEITETPAEEETLNRVYSFHGVPVGTAVAQVVKEEDDTLVINGQKNMEAAKDYSSTDNYIPYFVIAGIGLVLFLLLLFRMIKIIKK